MQNLCARLLYIAYKSGVEEKRRLAEIKTAQEIEHKKLSESLVISQQATADCASIAKVRDFLIGSVPSKQYFPQVQTELEKCSGASALVEMVDSLAVHGCDAMVPFLQGPVHEVLEVQQAMLQRRKTDDETAEEKANLIGEIEVNAAAIAKLCTLKISTLHYSSTTVLLLELGKCEVSQTVLSSIIPLLEIEPGKRCAPATMFHLYMHPCIHIVCQPSLWQG